MFNMNFIAILLIIIDDILFIYIYVTKIINKLGKKNHNNKIIFI